MFAKKLPKISEDRQEDEYKKLLVLFRKFLKVRSIEDKWCELEAMMEERATHLIHHAIDGLEISYDKAIQILESDPRELSDYELNLRTSIFAAIDNLVDFAVAEEYRMASKLPDWGESLYDDEEDDDDNGDYHEEIEETEDEEMLAPYIKVNKLYNNTYARVEDLDVKYAMIIAASYALFRSGTVLIYMTQGDHRVRPWHAALEGYSAPKELFPDWMIPPIEAACRCYLEEDWESNIFSKVKNSLPSPQMPFWFDRTYKESVAKGGRIFSDEHPYFQMDAINLDRLRDIANRIKKSIMSNGRHTD